MTGTRATHDNADDCKAAMAEFDAMRDGPPVTLPGGHARQIREALQAASAVLLTHSRSKVYRDAKTADAARTRVVMAANLLAGAITNTT
jgi:hypothetical protein